MGEFLQRRILGLETEFGCTAITRSGRGLTPDETARLLFRSVVAWGRSSNVFLPNGSRLYLDVGSHPEYATAECDDLVGLIAHDRAGERVLTDLADRAEDRLRRDGTHADIFLFKNNTDSHGNSYGCHENYLIGRRGEFSRWTDALVPFLVTRPLVAGAGHLLGDGRLVLSARADHLWEGVSSATTRSRPMINTRDEPHADPERFRRLHVISGDSTLLEPTTLIRAASTELMLRVIESGAPLRSMVLDNPVRSLRETSHDPTGRARLLLADGRRVSALELQRQCLDAVEGLVARSGGVAGPLARGLDLWREAVAALEADRPERLARSVEWVAKRAVLSRYLDRAGLAWDSPRAAQLALAWCDIRPGRGLARLCEERGVVDRVTTPEEVERAVTEPPSTTRARLRGRFVAAARAHGVDHTVDWVHLKINDDSPHAWRAATASSWNGRTVLCRDPFVAVDERVDALIEAMERGEYTEQRSLEHGPGTGGAR